MENDTTSAGERKVGRKHSSNFKPFKAMNKKDQKNSQRSGMMTFSGREAHEHTNVQTLFKQPSDQVDVVP